jgi:heat shock protein HspQ
MTIMEARFAPGEVVAHAGLGYRGVITDVDAFFCGDEAAYEAISGERPSREQPWYHVLVDGVPLTAYLPESLLARARGGEPVVNPAMARHFAAFRDGRYVSRQVLS